MAEPSENTRRALRGHLWHLLELLEKVREICGPEANSSVRLNYLHRLDGERLHDVERFLERFNDEVNWAAIQWGIDIDREQIEAIHALSVSLQFVGIALEEMSPSRLSGFGALDPAFEKDYAVFLQRLRGHLGTLQRALVTSETDRPAV
ncbi:hypothetical protein [Paraburkholderia oxyphila]|uniref:hypothetical protein n=1 Tax=Paraburkholderia oxyphila TaxID=614212 RepID=UPI000484056A|nr:hypothetical protein [Paraburkholderia oxyphila]